MGVATQPKCEMTQDTLFRTLLCVATQQVMGNKPSVKSRMKEQFHFLLVRSSMVRARRLYRHGYGFESHRTNNLPEWRNWQSRHT